MKLIDQGYQRKKHVNVLFYTSVHILWLVKLILGCCTIVNDLECEITGRGGGSGGGSKVDEDECSRLGNESEFPSELWRLSLKLTGRIFVIDVDCNVELPSDVVNMVPVRFLRVVLDLRGTTGNGLLVCIVGLKSIVLPNRLRFRCSIMITQTR
jgi:hypothetical protein